MISLSQISWLTAALAGIVVLATLIHLGALNVTQTLANREFAAALATDSGTKRPIVLFLRSFDIAQYSFSDKVVRELSYIALTGLSALQLIPVTRYDVEENLDDAIGLNAMFVALGDRLASYGAAKIRVKDEDWQNTFSRLADAAQLIFMMPGLSAGARWEFSQIVCSRRLREKTIFIMQPRSFSYVRSSPYHEWTLLSEAAAELGVSFPPYALEGCYFRLRKDGQPSEIVALAPFTRALSKFVTSPAYTGVIDFAEVVKLV